MTMMMTLFAEDGACVDREEVLGIKVNKKAKNKEKAVLDVFPKQPFSCVQY